MKAVRLNIGLDVSAGVYDPTKTSLMGGVSYRTVNARTTYSPPPPVMIDTLVDNATVPYIPIYTDNDRIFVLTAITTGLATISMYSVDIFCTLSVGFISRKL